MQLSTKQLIGHPLFNNYFRLAAEKEASTDERFSAMEPRGPIEWTADRASDVANFKLPVTIRAKDPVGREHKNYHLILEGQLWHQLSSHTPIPEGLVPGGGEIFQSEGLSGSARIISYEFLAEKQLP